MRARPGNDGMDGAWPAPAWPAHAKESFHLSSPNHSLILFSELSAARALLVHLLHLSHGNSRHLVHQDGLQNQTNFGNPTQPAEATAAAQRANHAADGTAAAASAGLLSALRAQQSQRRIPFFAGDHEHAVNYGGRGLEWQLYSKHFAQRAAASAPPAPRTQDAR